MSVTFKLELQQKENLLDERLKYLVDLQLKARGIRDKRVLTVMGTIERHRFVLDRDYEIAYDDRPLHIGSSQTISQPLMVAIMTEELSLKGDEKILEIGTGSGYQTAILAELGKEVFTIERIGSLQRQAKKILKNLKYENIHFKVGDGTVGWEEHAPYDSIIVTAAAPKIPQILYEQLAIGGRMVVPVGVKYAQDLKLVIKLKDGKMKVENRSRCIFVPLIGKEGWKSD